MDTKSAQNGHTQLKHLDCADRMRRGSGSATLLVTRGPTALLLGAPFVGGRCLWFTCVRGVSCELRSGLNRRRSTNRWRWTLRKMSGNRDVPALLFFNPTIAARKWRPGQQSCLLVAPSIRSFDARNRKPHRRASRFAREARDRLRSPSKRFCGLCGTEPGSDATDRNHLRQREQPAEPAGQRTNSICPPTGSLSSPRLR